MSLFRAGVLLLSLLLSACSSTAFNKTTHSQDKLSKIKIEKPNYNYTPSKKKIAKPLTPVLSNMDKEKLDDLQKIAKKQHNELQNRFGSAPSEPSINRDELTSHNTLVDAEQTLRTYNSLTSTKLAELDALVAQRKANSTRGDMLKIFISKTHITSDNENYMTQPLVGQWVRGETRTISLKDSILFNTKYAQSVSITYSNNYQVLINNQVISIVNPNKEKNTVPFNIQVSDNGPKIKGKLDYSVVNIKK